MLMCLEQKVSIDQTNLPVHLNEMLDMLVSEEQEGVTTGPCMEFMLQHNMLETLITLARTDVSNTVLLARWCKFKGLSENTLDSKSAKFL